VSGRVTSRTARRHAVAAAATVVVALMLVCGAGAGTATAGNSSDPTATATADSPDPTTYTARVSYTPFGIGNGDGSQPVQSSDTAFVPPVCWYTAMTPEQMKAEILRRYNDAGQRRELGDPPESRIAPKMLADAAYGRLMLPAKVTTQRDGARMADGLSEFSQAVTVRKIHTVNR
jgi:hypothetical protein